MTHRRQPDRVEPIENWDNARYSITPPRAALDCRLTLIHHRLMCWLGRVNARQGWVSMSQSDFARALGYHRGSVVRAIGELVTWRYVEKRGQDESKSARCHYRLLVDDPDPAESEACHVVGDTETCDAPRDTSESPDVTHVSPRIGTHLDHSSKVTPPTPKGGTRAGAYPGVGGVAEGYARGWTPAARDAVASLRASPVVRHVAEALIDAVAGTLRPAKGADAAAFVRQLGHRLRDFTPEALAATARTLSDTRGEYLPAAAEVERVARAAQSQLAASAKQAEARAANPPPAADPALVSRFSEVRRGLEVRLGADVARTWFASIEPVSLEHGVLTLAAPTRFHAQWVESHYLRPLAEVACAVLGSSRVRVQSQQRRAA